MQGDSSDMLNVFLVFGLSCLVVSVHGSPSLFDTPGLAESSVGNVRPTSDVVPKTSGVEGQSFAPALLSDTGEQYLQLCECEEASGTPEGLSCAKQGWFLSNFEHEGRWLVGGGSVPLSKAICCRPCLPSQLVGDGSEKPIALVSVDCHASTNSGMKEVQCEADSSSFAVGFPSAVRVPGSLAFYPVGTTQCCTPAIITDKGSTLRLHRCGCDHELFSSSINCGNDLNRINTHRLLWGYSGARITQDGKYVPIAPALCCRLCLSQEPFDPTCATLQRCSHHGSCMFGSCHCDDGWTGADCSVRASSHEGVSLPPWMSGMIILVVCTLGSFLFLCLRYCWDEMRTRRLLHAASEGGQPLEALMLRMGVDDGSVGSVDTEGEELDDCDGSPSVGVVIDDYLLQGTQSAPGSAAGESPGASEEGAEAMPLPQGERRAGVVEEVEEPKGAAVVAAEEDPQDLKEKVALLSGSSPSPLQQVMCSICMERPVQVVLVPCGHAMVCRRCSRRLERCPFCRKDIARRQRVYVSD